MELNASRSRWKQLYTCIYYEMPYKSLLFLFNWVVKSVVRPGFLWFYPDLLFLSLAVSVTHILIVLPFLNGKTFLSVSVFSWIFSSGVMTYFSAVRHPLTENHHVIVDGVHASVHILNEQLYRKLSYPLQLTYWANPEWNRSWLVKKLVRLVQNGKEPFFTSSPTELIEYWTGSALPGLLSSPISHWRPREFSAKEGIMMLNVSWL